MSSEWRLLSRFLSHPLFLHLRRTVNKISMSSSGHHMDALLKDVPMESIPKTLGGTYEGFNEPFLFNISSTGPFFLDEDGQKESESAISAAMSGLSIAPTTSNAACAGPTETSDTASSTSSSCCGDN